MTSKEAKSYVFQYRLPGQGRRGQARRITLGRHSELTAEQARKLAAGLLVGMRSGGDPAAERRPQESHTVAELAERFLTEFVTVR